jgi:vitamin K-dependent gamma-carboxylase-like protein
VTSRLEEMFGIDLRSLAALRIGIALLLLADLVNRSADLAAHYTDLGVLPRAAAVFPTSGIWAFSPYAWAGTAHAPLVMFAFAGLAALGLLLGCHTRWMTVASWGCLTALHMRNPLLCQDGDHLLRLLLFWSSFLPLGARFSVDGRRHVAARQLPARIVSMATVAMLAQVVFVYWFTAAHKSGAEWWQEGSAVYYALSLDRLATPVGQLLLGFPCLLRPLTYAVIWFEVLGPLLLFVPVCTGPIRTVVVCAFLALQLGFGLCLALGLFPWISAVAMLPFVPTWFWDRYFPQGKTMLCGMRRRHGTLTLPVSRGSQEREHMAGNVTGDGLIRISHPPPLPESSRAVRASWATDGLVLFLMVYVLSYNLATLKGNPAQMPRWVGWLGPVLQLQQRWDMFAPRPPKFSGWYVIPGRLADGTWRDVWHGGAVRWEKPPLVSAAYRNQRWRKYLRLLTKEKYSGYRTYFAHYLCAQWNARHRESERLEEAAIYFVREDTLPAYQPTEPQRLLLWQSRCAAARAGRLD